MNGGSDKEFHNVQFVTTRKPGTQVHWGVVVSVLLLALGTVASFFILTGLFNWDNEFFTYAFSLFLGILFLFVVMSFLALIIAWRYGYAGDWTRISMVLYVLLSATVIFIIFTYMGTS